MNTVIAIGGLLVLALVLWDAFETIVIPKTVERRLRLSNAYYRVIWKIWHVLAAKFQGGRARETTLQSFGPLSLIFLFVVWATALIFGFAMIHYGTGALATSSTFFDYTYYSGVTFFTLGYGDITSQGNLGRSLAVFEAGTGFGFLAIIIAYVPVLYQAFSQRERFIVMLDSRAGSNPSGGELILRHTEGGALPQLLEVLRDAEKWAAHQLEVYLSYPILAYYRSQHDTQSWLSAMTAIMDACAIIQAGMEEGDDRFGGLRFQAKATFAMARHVLVDIAYLLDDPPETRTFSRLSPDALKKLESIAHMAFGTNKTAFRTRLDDLRHNYEPYLIGLARDLQFSIPSWVSLPGNVDNWQLAAWDSRHFEPQAPTL